MRIRPVERGATGKYVNSTTAGEPVRAFIPSPLPPVPPMAIEGPLQQLHEQALVACGRLDGVSALLPDPDIFLYAYVRREAILSSQIEGTQSSLSDLMLFELDQAPGVPFDDVVEVSNYVAALDHAMKRLHSGFPLSARLLREVHAVLLAGGRGADKQLGEFRTTQNWIGGTRPGNARFVPPPPLEIADCISALERYIHAGNGASPLVKAGLAHVQFETIHPFLDGNGRVGRLLIALMLMDAKLLRRPLLYLSLHFKRHRKVYYDLLNTVRDTGDWEKWLDFFLEGVAFTVESAVDTAHRLLSLFEEDAHNLKQLDGGTANTMRVFETFKQSPLQTITSISAAIEIAYPTVSRAVQILETRGIVSEITGRKRERVYAYTQYLDILNEGSEPL